MKNVIPLTLVTSIFQIGHRSTLGLLCLAFLLFPSCRRSSGSETPKSNESADSSKVIGIWKADGVGRFSVEHYSLLIKFSPDQKCELTATYTTTKETLLTTPSIQIIDLEGIWKPSGDNVSSKLRVTNWTETFPPGTASGGKMGRRKIHEFDAHEMQSKWKISDSKLKLTGDLFLAIRHFNEPPGGDEIGSLNEMGNWMVGVPEFSRVMNRTDHNQAAPKTSENRRKATKLQPTADESDAKDPVGEWVTPEGHSPKFSLCLWKSGDARGEFESKDLSIYLDGSWKLIPDGRWKGYVTFSGMVEYWAVGGNDVTPKAEKFEFLLGPEPDRLIHVKSSFLTNKNGNKWFPSGERSDNDPNLIRQNNNRPDFREPGN